MEQTLLKQSKQQVIGLERRAAPQAGRIASGRKDESCLLCQPLKHVEQFPFFLNAVPAEPA